MREKSYVEDIDRSIYDFKDDEKDAYKVKAGLTPEIVQKISDEKKDPAWMQLFRLHSLQIYNQMPIPDWGPSIEGLNMDDIVTYVRPNTKMKAKWSDVPDDIKNTFERLGIPQAERKSLAGVGAQYDSELVYHNVRAEVAAQGVVYTDMESALHGEYADMVRKHFMKLVKPTDHKFAALHGAVWSGGSFVYVPKGVSVEIPLQSYFRLNAPGAGQFEHTLIIVDEDADLHFIEGCSAPKYNVANLHAGCVELFVGKGDVYDGIWTELQKDHASLQAEIGYLLQNQQKFDVNLNVRHFGKVTESTIQADGTLMDAAEKIFRGTIDFVRGSADSVGAETEQVLLLGDDVVNKTIPVILCAEENVQGSHGAAIGELDEETLFYFGARGMDRTQAENTMARAKLEAKIQKIGDADIEQKVKTQLAEVLDRDNR